MKRERRTRGELLNKMSEKLFAVKCLGLMCAWKWRRDALQTNRKQMHNSLQKSFQHFQVLQSYSSVSSWRFVVFYYPFLYTSLGSKSVILVTATARDSLSLWRSDGLLDLSLVHCAKNLDQALHQCGQYPGLLRGKRHDFAWKNRTTTQEHLIQRYAECKRPVELALSLSAAQALSGDLKLFFFTQIFVEAKGCPGWTAFLSKPQHKTGACFVRLRGSLLAEGMEKEMWHQATDVMRMPFDFGCPKQQISRCSLRQYVI